MFDLVNNLLLILLTGVLFIPFFYLIEEMDTKMQVARPKVTNNKIDKLWHKYEFYTKLYVGLVIAIAVGMSIHFIVAVSIMVLPLSFQIGNMYWNYKNNQDLDYPGDGKNSAEEKLVTSIVGKDYNKRRIFTIAYKVVIFLIGILWYIYYTNIYEFFANLF